MVSARSCVKDVPIPACPERKAAVIDVTTDPQKIGQALGWIVALLTRYRVPYQICGGLAAKAYGATRPLVDIDIYASLEGSPAFRLFLAEVRPYLIRDLAPYRSATWDLRYLALSYQGIQIELAESSAKPRFYNQREHRWEDQVIAFATSTHMLLYGVEVAIMPKGELLAYKSLLDRAVDRLDVEDMTTVS
jgi:hypothetical protein